MVRDQTIETSAPDARLAAAIEQLGRLPVLSATVRRVRVLAESDESGIGDMLAALEADRGLAGRLGGDEFAVWVPGPPPRGDQAAANLLDAVAAAFAESYEGPQPAVSIGTASPDTPADSLASVLSRADEALYEAKRAGRGRAGRS